MTSTERNLRRSHSTIERRSTWTLDASAVGIHPWTGGVCSFSRGLVLVSTAVWRAGEECDWRWATNGDDLRRCRQWECRKDLAAGDRDCARDSLRRNEECRWCTESELEWYRASRWVRSVRRCGARRRDREDKRRYRSDGSTGRDHCQWRSISVRRESTRRS